jgi:phosphoribosylglycinamide formyltransferase-1
MKNLVVLISGDGSNLQAVIDACRQGMLSARIAAVFSNRADAYGLQRARQADLPAYALSAKDYADRESFDRALMQRIDAHRPDAVILAGYMRILSPAFVQRYAGKLLNIHPSLLPLYPGLHTHRQVLANGDRIHGTSVHFVTEQLDGGQKYPSWPEKMRPVWSRASKTRNMPSIRKSSVGCWPAA